MQDTKSSHVSKVCHLVKYPRYPQLHYPPPPPHPLALASSRHHHRRRHRHRLCPRSTGGLVVVATSPRCRLFDEKGLVPHDGEAVSVCVCICVHVYVFVCMCVCMYVCE